MYYVIQRSTRGIKSDDDQLFLERAPLWVTPVTIMGFFIVFLIGYVKELLLKMAQSLNLLPAMEKNREVYYKMRGFIMCANYHL